NLQLTTYSKSLFMTVLSIVIHPQRNRQRAKKGRLSKIINDYWIYFDYLVLYKPKQLFQFGR
ncbi:MAG: hypothetical protein QME81_09615, partial [bacterium]|nr:hypothetical protein [bacterium]